MKITKPLLAAWATSIATANAFSMDYSHDYGSDSNQVGWTNSPEENGWDKLSPEKQKELANELDSNTLKEVQGLNSAAFNELFPVEDNGKLSDEWSNLFEFSGDFSSDLMPPTSDPSVSPTPVPTHFPTSYPSSILTEIPTQLPSMVPTVNAINMTDCNTNNTDANCHKGNSKDEDLSDAAIGAVVAASVTAMAFLGYCAKQVCCPSTSVKEANAEKAARQAELRGFDRA